MKEEHKANSYSGKEIDTVDLKHLSASKLNTYLECPLKFFYSYVIKTEKPQSTSEGFDVREGGSLMHLCFENFAKHIKDNSSIGNERLNKLMLDISNDSYKEFIEKEITDKENSYHRLYLSELQKGLVGESKKGLLARFVEYFKDNREKLNNFIDSEFEREFWLDNEFKLLTQDEVANDNYFISGKIDRIDNLEDQVFIIDYKSSKVTSTSGFNTKKQLKLEVQDSEDLPIKDVQLPLYMLWAEQEIPNKDITSSLLSFKNGTNQEMFTGNKWGANFVNISTKGEAKEKTGRNKNDITQTHYTEEYREKLKTEIIAIKEKIEKGDFGMTPSEDSCKYCDIKNFCFGKVEKDEEDK